MPNFVDNTAINNALKDKIARVRTEKAKDWFSRNARNWLSNREDCAQLITLGESNLPDWAIRRLQTGEAIHRFRLSEAANDILTNCLRYIRSLEYTTVEQDVEVTFIHEATRRLDQLKNIPPDNIAPHYESWETLKNPKIDRSTVIPAQIDDGKTRIDATNNRFWERITTLDRLENTGKELGGICLARGDYDGEFIRGESAFWRLNNENKDALAVMEIDISKYYTASEYTAIQFKQYKNQLAREYAKDAVILLEEKQYSNDGSDDFKSIGITSNKHKPDTSWRKGAKTKTFNEIKFYRTDKGIATSNDDESPNWIVLKHNINAGRQGAPKYIYRLLETGFEMVKQIEDHPTIAKCFWSWVDPDNNMGVSYSSLVEATGNPFCSNLQPNGWFNAEDAESWSIWDGIIPNLSNSITIKYRWVFDEEGCNSIKVDGTNKKRDYALQLAVFVNDELEISCLILAKLNRVGNWQNFFRMLTSDFKSPSAVAALLSALWIGMDELVSVRKFLQEYVKKNKTISVLVEHKKDVKPYYYSPNTVFHNQQDTVIINEWGDWDDEGTYSQLYSVDANGNMLWTAVKGGVCLDNPIIYQEDAGIESVISYIQDQGLSVEDEDKWKDYLNKKGYLRLKDGGINPIVSMYLNELETDINNNTLKAVRVLDENEFTWTILDECDDELWMLYPAQNHNHLRLDSFYLNEKISSGVKILVHAILDGCGKTMSPAQLGLLNLMPLSGGGHKIADVKSFPLATQEIEINEHLSWVQESTDWYLRQNNKSVCIYSYRGSCRDNYVSAGTEHFSLPSMPITEEITSAIIQFSNLLQQAAELPFIFKNDSQDELSEKLPNIKINL